MKNVEVQFNTRTQTVKGSLNELRHRCRQNPRFIRLLKVAAYAQLRRGEHAELRASNSRALRALELAVCAFRRTMELDTLGQPTRDVYLMRERKAWQEVSKERAHAEMKRISLDAITVMKVTVYAPDISREDADALDAEHAPETVFYITDETLPVSDARSRDSAHPNIIAEDAATYNDAGELETPEERRERLTKRGPRRERRETWEDAERPLPLRTTAPERPPKTEKPLPAAPWYHALESHMAPEDWATLNAERRAHEQRRALLDDDENERLELYDLDAELSPEDLEEGMLEPWEALENYAAVQ